MGRIDYDRDGVVDCRCDPANVAYKAAAVHVRTSGAYSNNVTLKGDTQAGACAQGRVANAGTVSEGGTADSRVRGAVIVGGQCIETDGRVRAAGGIGNQRIETDSGVGGADIVKERASADGRVVITVNVCKERAITDSRVLATVVVVQEGERSIGRVEGAGGVEEKRYSASGRILISGVEHKRSSANTRIKAAGGVAEERKPTKCCIPLASAEVFKGVLPFCRG